MTRSKKVAEPSESVTVLVVPLAKAPVFSVMAIGTPFVGIALLNESVTCTTKVGSVWPAVFVATGRVV